jgi:hypothetical protein
VARGSKGGNSGSLDVAEVLILIGRRPKRAGVYCAPKARSAASTLSPIWFCVTLHRDEEGILSE